MDTSNGMESVTVTFNTFPSIPDVCAIAHCLDHANPANAVVANLDIFGSPEVQVWFCDNHYHFFQANTDEHVVPDLVFDEELP